MDQVTLEGSGQYLGGWTLVVGRGRCCDVVTLQKEVGTHTVKKSDRGGAEIATTRASNNGVVQKWALGAWWCR